MEPNCASCRKQKATCWVHMVTDVTCRYCSVVFSAPRVNKACPECVIARLAERNRGEIRSLVDKVCTICGQEYRGAGQSRYCVPCLVQKRREKNAAYVEKLRSGHRARKPEPVRGSKIPPPCQQCHYCKETDMYPSGMVCLAEAFLRCQPLRPGAQPLKRRKNA